MSTRSLPPLAVESDEYQTTQIHIQEQLKLYLSKQDYRQVKSIALSAIDRGYKSAEIYRALGQTMLKAKSWTRVVESYDTVLALARKPKLSDYLHLMNALYQLLLIEHPMIEHAERVLSAASVAFGDHYQILLYKARFAVFNRQHLEAETIWHRVYAEHEPALTNMEIAEYARLLKNHGQYVLALDTLEKRLITVPESIPLLREISRVKLTAKTQIKVLADKPEYKITYFKQIEPSDVLFITFGTAPSGLAAHPFGFDFLIKQGFNLVYVAQQKGSQYQNLSVDAFRQYIQPITQDQNVFTYGSSLGGYCALYFAGCIDAVAIAAGPRNPCDPCLKVFTGPELGPYRDVPHHHPKIAEQPRSRHEPFIIYDPAIEIDQTFFIHQVQSAYPNANIWPVPHGGHPTLQILAEQGILKSFVLSIVEKQQFPPNTLDFDNSAIWNFERAVYLLKQAHTDHAIAVRHLKKSIELNPSADAYIALVSTLRQINAEKSEIDIYRSAAQSKFPKHKKIMFL